VLGDVFKNSPDSSGPSVQAILTEAQHKDLIQRLNSTKHTDLLAAPRVTTRVGQRAVIEIIREFRYPTAFNAEQPIPTPKDFETRNVGITIEALAERISGDQLRLVLVPQVVEFLGFVNYNGGKPASGAPRGDALSALLSEPLVSTAGVINQPIFATRKITTSIPIKSGQTALLFGIDSSSEEVVQEKGLLERLGAPNLGAPPAGKTPKVVKRSLFMLVTPRIVDPTAAPPAAQSLPPASTPVQSPDADSGKFPTGTAVPNKPGFITSPHAPKAGYIDVRGFPSGVEVKCPYTGEMLIVP
jgi:general secretion pathway protein D